MQTLFAFELLFLMVILFVENGETLKCFQCRSDSDKGCGSAPISKYSKECSNSTYCRKIAQKLKFNKQKVWTSIRECAKEKQPGSECYRFKWVELGYQEVCECDTENCNRGSRRILDVMGVAIVFSTIWIFI